MANMSVERIYRALPDKPMRDEAELDEMLRRVLDIPEWDNARLGAVKLVVTSNRLVLRADDGSLVKGELPAPQSFAEAQNDRIAEIAATQRRQRELLYPPEKYLNPMRVQTEQFISELIGTRFDALEAQVLELQQQVDVLITHEIAA